MGIDPDKVRAFWTSQVRKYGRVPPESVTNLEEDPAVLALKVRLEKEKVFQYVTLDDETTVLDLGAGSGTWALRFAEIASRVVGVDYIEEFLECAEREARSRGLENVQFICSPAQEYSTDEVFDLVFISGLFVYLNDADCRQMLNQISRYTGNGSRVVVRDGVGIQGRYELYDTYSSNLKANYSAIYRTRDTYIRMFKARGFEVVKDEDMFPSGCALNKYPETRLRIFLFERKA